MHSSSSPSPHEGGRKSLDESLAPGQENNQTAALHKSVTLIPLRTTANVKNGRVNQAQVLTPLFLIVGREKGRKSFFVSCEQPPEHDAFHPAYCFISSFRIISVSMKSYFWTRKEMGKLSSSLSAAKSTLTPLCCFCCLILSLEQFVGLFPFSLTSKH